MEDAARENMAAAPDCGAKEAERTPLFSAPALASTPESRRESARLPFSAQRPAPAFLPNGRPVVMAGREEEAEARPAGIPERFLRGTGREAMWRPGMDLSAPPDDAAAPEPAARNPQPLPAVPLPPGGPAAMDPTSAHKAVEPPKLRLTREQGRALVRLAETSAGSMQSFLDRAAAATAKARDREAARDLGECVSAIAKDAGPLGQLVKKLRDADAQGIDPDLSLDEAKALEAFAACAQAVEERHLARAKADAAVGTGVPAIGIAALLLL